MGDEYTHELELLASYPVMVDNQCTDVMRKICLMCKLCQNKYLQVMRSEGLHKEALEYSKGGSGPHLSGKMLLVEVK